MGDGGDGDRGGGGRGGGAMGDGDGDDGPTLDRGGDDEEATKIEESRRNRYRDAFHRNLESSLHRNHQRWNILHFPLLGDIDSN